MKTPPTIKRAPELEFRVPVTEEYGQTFQVIKNFGKLHLYLKTPKGPRHLGQAAFSSCQEAQRWASNAVFGSGGLTH